QVARLSDSEVDARVNEMVGRLRLRGFEDRPADQLSGGERQRVALARTLASRPKLVLLDEPFAAVDMEIKAELRSEFREVLREMGVTAVHVTHDREEALFLGDRVAVLIDGRMEQIGEPVAVHDAPATERVARFLGYNILRAGREVVAVHPDELQLIRPGDAATVIAAGPAGRATVVYVRSDNGARLTARSSSTMKLRPGDRVGLQWARSISFPGRSETGPGILG
ncbi:MAG: ATP-binding cassette domain-containing protein, partial [Thermoplasmata archaeon]|nr:ATP-binding cassette domain-containing protein [Thermoplasmata archaeon]